MCSRNWRCRTTCRSWRMDCSRRCGCERVLHALRGDGSAKMTIDLPSERGQIAALARAFLARFFDNDLTAGSTDLKHSFLWLIAAAAMPGIAMPSANMEKWSRLAIIRGPEGGPEFLRMS